MPNSLSISRTDAAFNGRVCFHLHDRGDCCCAGTAGAVDDIRRATDIALRSVSEFGLSAAVGPLNVGVLAAGGSDDGAWLMRDNGTMAQLVEAEVGGCWSRVAFSVWACGRVTVSAQSMRIQYMLLLCL